MSGKQVAKSTGTKITPENLQKKIGYGHGTNIGYSDDGKVWFISDSKAPDGKPTQFMMFIEPEAAERMAASFVEAARMAKGMKNIAGTQ